jgi:hypothetical protein
LILHVVTLEKARDAVLHLNDSTDYARDAVPFSLVQSVCLKLLLSIPNHWSIILVAIIKVDDGSSARILYRYNNVTLSNLFLHCLLLYVPILYLMYYCFWFISMALIDLQKNITNF